MTIAGVQSALPKHQYDQAVLLSALQRHWGPKVDNPVFMQRLQARVGVNTRHLALPIEEYYELKSWGKANNHWIDVATELGEKALCGALTRSGFAPSDLGAIFFVSITGISSPSIDARLINKMNLPVNIKRVPIFGLGCVAGAAGISRAAGLIGRAAPAPRYYVLADAPGGRRTRHTVLCGRAGRLRCVECLGYRLLLGTEGCRAGHLRGGRRSADHPHAGWRGARGGVG